MAECTDEACCRDDVPLMRENPEERLVAIDYADLEVSVSGIK